LLQDKMIDEEIVNENISFITYQILKNKGLLDEYKYDFKYLLCFVKNQDEIKIDIADSTTDYPIEYLKDIVEIQFPQASFLDLGSKYRFTKYFIHLAELYSFSIDYRKETFESAIELIKKHFSIARTFFKKNSEGEYATDEQKQISETEENLRNMEITRSFIYELHEIFNIEPVSKTIEFKSGKDSYQYDYFEINKDLLEQVPTTKQAQQLINLFDILKKELPKENVEIYAKIIYTLLKKNSYLSVFNSAEDHIKLVDFLFEGFSKAKDDYINEILDRYNISPSQYDELKNKTTLVQYEQQTEDANVAVAKEEILYFTIENITNQEDRINFLLWLMSSNQDSKYYRTYTLGNIKCKNNDDVVINFDSFRTEFQLMSKTERENVIRTIFLGSNGILNKKESKEKNISEVIIGLQNVLFNNLFFSDEKVNNLNVAMANMFKKIFEIVFRNISDERKVVFVNNLFSALIDIKNETENSDMEEGELRARQLGRLIVAIGVNSGMAVLKLLQILSNNKVFEQLDDKYGYIINEEVSKVRSENEPLSKFVIFKYLERLGLLDKVEVVGKCLGSASIGLTYLIKFIGKKMFDVIKIKRPNIMKNYEEDFFVFSKIREYIISETSPLPEQYKKMIPKAEHLKNLFDEELNFGIESENLRQFSKQLKARNSEILVPELINNGRVLFTQTSAKGHSLNNIELSLAERKEINFKILKEFFTEVFFDAQNSPTGQALYHADLHAGNIFITANGNITFIDLGGVGNVDIKRSKSLKKIFIFLCLGNYNGFISSLKEFNRNIPRQLSSASKSKIKEILERNVPLENKFADLFEIFNNLENMDRDFLMFMQSISKIAVYIDELELIDEIGKPNLKDILEYGKKLLNKDLSGVEKFVRENIEVLKKLAVSIYMKNYNGFIKALSLYNQSIVETLDADEKEQIKNILKRKMTLQEKLVDLIEILDKLNIVDENFLLLLEITNNIIYYVGEAELKDIITKIFVSKIFTFSSKKQKKMEQTETRIDIEKDSILEIVLSKCKDISKDKIKSLENKLQNINKDAIKMCLKNSIVNLNLNQIIIFIDIANYLYKKEFITGKNEQDKINLLFKVVTRFNFNDEQIKKLFEMDAKFIDEILKKVEKINSKRKQKSLLKKFLKEKNKLDLEIIDMEILKTMLDFSNKGNPIFDILPSDIAKKILNDPKKLKFLLNFLSAGNNAEYNNDSMDFDLSLIVKLIDLPYEILETLPNGRYYHGEANYMYNFHKFCDLYEKCYDENKFYNTHKFVITLLNFTTVKYRDISSRYYKFYTKIKNIGIILSWKIPVINKFMKFISTHKKLTKKDKQIINIFREAVDIKTLEEISKTVYKLKLKTILKEAHKFDIPISIDNVKFKSLLMCLKNGIPITSEVRTKIANTTDFNDFKPYVYNLLSNKKKMMERFSFLDKNAYIWEEIVFKVIPIVVSAFNPVVGLYVFVSSQVFFILAHFIPKILKGKNLNEAFVETKELIFSLPTLMSLLFTLLLGINTLILDLDSSSFFQLIIPIILTLFSIPSIIIHKQYNEEHTLNPLSIAKNILEARQLKAFITKYDVVETDGFITKTVKTILGTIAKETNKIKHVIIDYKTIKASGIKQAIELFGTNARLNEEGQISVGIVEDIEEIRDSFTLINTGIKIDGSSIYRIKNSDLLMYGAKGQTSIKVAQALNGTKEIKEALQEMGLTETSNTETEGVVMIDGVGIEINNGLLEIGEIELEGKTPQQIKEYITTALEIKRALGIMYGQKTIIDLKNLTGSALIKAVENGRARKVITEEQYRKLELNKEKIKELKEKGIEIYVACNEIKDEYRQNEISGQIIRDSKTNKAYIYDYYSMDKTEIDEITNQKDLAKLEDKIVNGENLIMIDIDLLKKSFQGSNIIESFTKLGALT
ncbi:MAG: hypothetical protein IKN42_02840, partial [Elusimicrobia bacterium]|nr:hypothetical protein [Elusimicrobiota bacterium]